MMARPLSIVAEVCMVCGTLDPVSPTPTCAHPRVAAMAEVPRALVDTLDRLRRAQRALDSARASLADVVELEVAAGRAIVDRHPPLAPMAPNVVHLRPRGELRHQDGSPVVEGPSSRAEQPSERLRSSSPGEPPSRAAGRRMVTHAIGGAPLELKPTKKPRRRRRKPPTDSAPPGPPQQAAAAVDDRTLGLFDDDE